jgi:DNA polymerase (family 10)
VELNAYPNRLDLDWVHCRRAKELGVKLAINPDAHSTADLENIEYGVATARRAWLEPKDVVNTRELDEVLELLDA